MSNIAVARPTGPKPYQEYSASGIEWLGEVPAHWKELRARFLFRERDERVEMRELELLALTRAGLVRRAGLDQRAQEADSYEKYKVCYPGDLVMNKMQAWNGAFAFAEELGKVSPDYTVFTPLDESLARWGAFLFKTDGYRAEFLGRCRGMGTGFLRLNSEDFFDVRLALPPPPERSAILSFLACNTAKIDALIEKQRRLIELLKEKRAALITQAVTKGLDPSVPMKDSGVEWLGQIPEHWEVRRLRFGATIRLSSVDKKSEAREEDTLLCNYVDVYKNEYIDSHIEFVKATATPGEIRRFAVRKGDVLVTKDSETWDDIGVPALVIEDLNGVTCGYHLAQIRCSQGLHPAFLFRALHAIGVKDQMHVRANGITRYGIGARAIGDISIPSPPLDEQTAISTFLHRETAKIDALVEKNEKIIELLKEYRSALISAAVTGKIDVREAGAK